MEDLTINLEKSFDELGVTFDEPVLRKCVELCNKYGVTEAEDFVDSWMAYSVSHFRGANPTVGHLARFERDELIKKSKADTGTAATKADARSSLVIYEASAMDTDLDDASDMLNVYNGGEVIHRADKRQTTPRSNDAKRSRLQGEQGGGRVGSSAQVAFSPASFSPTIATPSSKYTTRTNAGEVVARFGKDGSPMVWPTSDQRSVTVSSRADRAQLRHMCFDLLDCVEAADEALERLGALLCAKHSLEDTVSARYKHPSPCTTIGRISCDADGRLNAKSVLLEGSREAFNGDSVQLDLSAIDRFSLFPGQVVAVEGLNVTGDKLVAKRLFCDGCIQPPPPFPALEHGPLSMVVAAGPFTQSDSMNYQPLLDLMDRVVADEPHLLILTGPFIDINHPFIADNTIAETFQALFGKLVEQIMKPLEGLRTKVALVASYKDCHGQCVYPTPQLHVATTRAYPKLHLLPDPCLLDVEGVVVGVTSTDILMHLGKEEISCPPHSADRLSRLASHVLAQRSFYPLCPPAEEVPLDPTLLEAVALPVTPHILVLPSDLRYFIKEVAGCVVVNPERLAKGMVGGTFSTMVVSESGVRGHVVKI